MKFEAALVEIFGDRNSEFSDDLRSRLHELFTAGAEAQRRMTDADYRRRVDSEYQMRVASEEFAVEQAWRNLQDRDVRTLIFGDWKL